MIPEPIKAALQDLAATVLDVQSPDLLIFFELFPQAHPHGLSFDVRRHTDQGIEFLCRGAGGQYAWVCTDDPNDTAIIAQRLADITAAKTKVIQLSQGERE